METGPWKHAAAFAVVLAAVPAAAAAQGQVTPAPGLITASNPAYPVVDVAVDRLMYMAGMQSPGDIAFERASEASVAARQNDSRARRDALSNLNQIAAVASSNDTRGLVKAEQVLEQVRERVPEEADAGVSAALENVRAAQERAPDEVPAEIPAHPGDGVGGMGNAAPG
ncbi:MAG: hypothetical protein ABEK12_00090 [Candidatus Nanohaloarchaea archaeon]